MISNFSKIVKTNTLEAEKLAAIDFSRLPKHVAVIMDGNGRWAKQRGKPRIFGHRAGVESVRAICDTTARLGLEAITLYAFSTENWKRPQDEVGALFQMLKHFVRSELKTLSKNNMRFQAIGKLEGLAKDVQEELQIAKEKTQNNTGTILSVALNYGGRVEIVDACKKAVKSLLETGKSIEDFSEQNIDEHLYTQGLPEVDLLIRTSGEMRISNFLLWQIAYSEIYITETLFPDFRREQIFDAVIEYQKRERRFGDIGSSVGSP
jgi:undecaprenyl diphosphate synthase